MATPYAFVTLVSSDSYLPGALTLVSALREVHPQPPVSPQVPFQIVCLVTPETVGVSSIKRLRENFDLVVGVEIIEQEDLKGLQLLGRLDLNTVLTKLHVFRLTQFSKIVFLDADVLPIRPLSHLFVLPHEFSAVPDVGWPDIFNSGVMVLSPGEEKFRELVDLFKRQGSWDGGDQGLLNEWRGENWNRLSFIYNTTPTAAYTYAPAYERFGSQISAIHFIGPDKPWKALPWRAPGTKNAHQLQLGPQQTYDYSSLLDRWFDVYDRHHRTESSAPSTAFEVQRYTPVWDEVSSRKGRGHDANSDGVLNLNDLKKIAIEGFSSIYNGPRGASLQGSKPSDGEYRSMPLEGRVDLMRRRKEPPPAHRAAAPMPREDDAHLQRALPQDQQVELPAGVQQMRMYAISTIESGALPPAPFHSAHTTHFSEQQSTRDNLPYAAHQAVIASASQRGYHGQHRHREQALSPVYAPPFQDDFYDSDQYSSEAGMLVAQYQGHQSHHHFSEGWNEQPLASQSHPDQLPPHHTATDEEPATYSRDYDHLTTEPGAHPRMSEHDHVRSLVSSTNVGTLQAAQPQTLSLAGLSAQVDPMRPHTSRSSYGESGAQQAQPSSYPYLGPQSEFVSSTRTSELSESLGDTQGSPSLRRRSSRQRSSPPSTSPQQHFRPLAYTSTLTRSPQDLASLVRPPPIPSPSPAPLLKSHVSTDVSRRHSFPSLTSHHVLSPRPRLSSEYDGRPLSPPKVSWNPAVEPPPNDPPVPSAFPIDTYFPNAWDQPLPQGHDQGPQSHSVPSTPGNLRVVDEFFTPPPPPVIPEQLLWEGQYTNVLGSVQVDEVSGSPSAPLPDPNKVKNVFPWEETPRHYPKRIFPASDLPPADKFIEEAKPTPHSPDPTRGYDRSHPQIHTPSPPIAFPPNLTFVNAWDIVPDIQKYASKLVQPRQPIHSHHQPSDNDGRKRDNKEREKRQDRHDASSMDGDDEDEGDTEGDNSDGSSKGRSSGRRKPHLSSSPTIINKGRKEYRMRGVQTDPPDTQSKAVQVSVLREDGPLAPREPEHEAQQIVGTSPPQPRPSHVSVSPRTYSPPRSSSLPETSPLHAYSPPGMSTLPGHSQTAPTFGTLPPRPPLQSALPISQPSPRQIPTSSPQLQPEPPIARALQSTPPPRTLPKLSSPFSPQLTRSASAETHVSVSPSTTYSSLNTPENTPISGTRRGGRVWDPSRGVDVIKRGSEEVLARFLRTGPFEQVEEQKRQVS